MNFSICARQRIPAVRCVQTRGMAWKRSKKSQKPKSPAPEPVSAYSPNTPSHATLPPAKMRALVALYHQAEEWITPETLMERIDATFVPQNQGTAMDTTGPRGARPITFEEIDRAKRVILEAPKMSKWDATAGAALSTRHESNATGSWSNNRAVRERRVIEALYGVVANQDSKLQPGLEVVEESAAWIKGPDRR